MPAGNSLVFDPAALLADLVGLSAAEVAVYVVVAALVARDGAPVAADDERLLSLAPCRKVTRLNTLVRGLVEQNKLSAKTLEGKCLISIDSVLKNARKIAVLRESARRGGLVSSQKKKAVSHNFNDLTPSPLSSMVNKTKSSDFQGDFHTIINPVSNNSNTLASTPFQAIACQHKPKKGFPPGPSPLKERSLPLDSLPKENTPLSPNPLPKEHVFSLRARARATPAQPTSARADSTAAHASNGVVNGGMHAGADGFRLTPPEEPVPERGPGCVVLEGWIAERDLRAEFDAWWQVYPQKVSKGAAERAWPRARREASYAALVAGLRRYMRTKPPDVAWCHPATWLNGKRWLDQPAQGGSDGANGFGGAGGGDGVSERRRPRSPPSAATLGEDG